MNTLNPELKDAIMATLEDVAELSIHLNRMPTATHYEAARKIDCQNAVQRIQRRMRAVLETAGYGKETP